MSEGRKGCRSGIDRWDEAMSWHERLSEARDEELTSAVGREWENWYSDAENRRTFDAVSRLLADRRSYHKRRRPTRSELVGDGYDLSVPIAEWRKAQKQKGKQRRFMGNRSRWLFGGAAVATIAAIVVLIILWPLRLWPALGSSTPVFYQTEVGELKDVHLQDGSSIVLGGQTKLSIAFSAQRRAVTLLEGQAWFKVAHDPRWPFVVAAGDGTITAVGTAFLVTRDSDRVVVTVTEGAVEVTAQPHIQPPPRLDKGVSLKSVLAPTRVSRGEELAFGDNGALSPVKPTDTHAATTWTHGRLTFDNQPLRYVIETVDRYSPRHILASPAAGALRFSGIVRDDGIEDWLQGLPAIFPVTVEERGGDVRIQMSYSAAVTGGSAGKAPP